MILNSFSLIPSLLLVIFGQRNLIERLKTDTVASIFDVLAFLVQLTVLAAWPLLLLLFSPETDSSVNYWVPIVILFVSCGYWENYVNVNFPNRITERLKNLKDDFKQSRCFIYLLLSLWKMCIILATMLLIIYANDGSEVTRSLFSKFNEAFESQQMSLREIRDSPLIKEGTVNLIPSHIHSSPSMIIWFIVLQIVSSYICWLASVFACRICIQVFSFTLPLNLVTSFSLALLTSLGALNASDKCKLIEAVGFFQYVFWEIWDSDDLLNNLHLFTSLVWVLSFLSQLWVTRHLWKPNTERMATTEKLFVRPFYSSVLVDQSILLNRRKEIEVTIKPDTEQATINNDRDHVNINHKPKLTLKTSSSSMMSNEFDEPVKIYACATMWHETNEEMMQMLKSVMRVDADQCARRQARKWFAMNNDLTDYYEFESIHDL